MKQLERYEWGSPLDWHWSQWSGPLYKSVSIEHADRFAAGSVKIGTIWGFRDLEGTRRDVTESVVQFDFQLIGNLDTDKPQDRMLLKWMGLKTEPGIKIVTNNAKINFMGQDHYAFCLSKSLKTFDNIDISKHAIFQIDDIQAWANRICEIFPELGPSICKPVRYEDPSRFRVVRGTAFPDPFVKPIGFSWEEEVRVIWQARTDAPVGPFPALTIILEDAHLANHARRIA